MPLDRPKRQAQGQAPRPRSKGRAQLSEPFGTDGQDVLGKSGQQGRDPSQKKESADRSVFVGFIVLILSGRITTNIPACIPSVGQWLLI